MSKLVEFFLNRPMLVKLIIITVFGAGLASAYFSKKEGFPEISLNKVLVQTLYPGASAGDVELNVTVPIEEALEEVEGIKEILSTSEEGISRIEIQADEDASPEEFRSLFYEVDKAITGIDDFPNDLDGIPSISEFTSSDIPILEVAYTGSYEQLKPYLENLKQRIKKIKGVASVNLIGLPDQEVQILVDPKLARQKMIDLKTIAAAIKKRNLEGSGGTLESFLGEKKVVFLSKFKNCQDVLETNIKMGSEGYGVKLKEVATVKILPEDINLIVRNNGQRGASLIIKKTGSSDLVKTVDNIKDLLAEENLPQGVGSKIFLDQSSLTRDRLSLLIGNSLIGFVLVIIVLFIFFDLRTALWTAFGIPFTLFCMLIFLKVFGLSLNIISLAGFILIIGMIVDDAIVIAEKINDNKEQGFEPKQAGLEAVKKMWLPVLAASLTTMAAFSPIFSVGGFPGKFVWTIPLMVIVGLFFSLLESFFLLPVHLQHGQSEKVNKKRFIIKLEEKYVAVLRKVVKFRYLALFIFILILLYSAWFLKNFVHKDPFPQEAAEGFTIPITMPKGSSVDLAEQQLKVIEEILEELPEEELIGYSSRVGTKNERSTTERGSLSNTAVIFVYLKPFSDRTRTAEQIIKSVRQQIAHQVVDKKIKININLTRLGPPLGRDFEIRLVSNNEALRSEVGQKIKNFLSSLKGVEDLESDEVEGKDELNLTLDYDFLARTDLTVEDVLTTLRIAFDGVIVTDLTTVDQKINFRLRLNEKARADSHFINDLPIMNKRGNLIKLRNFVTLEEKKARGIINHLDGKRLLTLWGNVNLKTTTPIEIMEKVENEFFSYKDHQKLEISFSGQPVESKKIFAGLGLASLGALGGIFLLISLMFNSFSKSFLIMLTFPFLIIGLVFTVIVHSIPISMMAGVALVGLLGIVVNDSIVMVHTIVKNSQAGIIIKDDIIKGAVSRLRPVILTTITTVLGVLPTGYGLGGYDPFLSHMSLVLAYGLLFSTTITLFIVPIFYSIGLDFRRNRLN